MPLRFEVICLWPVACLVGFQIKSIPNNIHCSLIWGSYQDMFMDTRFILPQLRRLVSKPICVKYCHFHSCV